MSKNKQNPLNDIFNYMESSEVNTKSDNQLTEKASNKRTRKNVLVEDTHTRMTFLIREDLKQEIDALSDKMGWGSKTQLANEAFKYIIDKYSDN